MSKNVRHRGHPNAADVRIVEVKSKLDAEYRRFSLPVGASPTSFEEFHGLLRGLHRLGDLPFTLWFTDEEGDLLPINNDNNFARAVRTTKRTLRLTVLKNGDALRALTLKKNPGGVASILQGSALSLLPLHRRGGNHADHPIIGFPEDFRRVSAIIDVDLVPETCRRVRLMKSPASDRPLGFYIRDGASIRVTPQGLEKVDGIFVSRMTPGGIAESTGLLAVNDEILEVNGIEVSGKTLDQVTDMMVANSDNLVITVKPVNQHNNVVPRKGAPRPELPRRSPGPTGDVPGGLHQGQAGPRVSAKVLPSGVQVLEL